MNSFSYKTETISAVTKILIIGSSQNVTEEVINQLREKTNLQIEIIPKFPALLKSIPDIAVNFVGFNIIPASQISSYLTRLSQLIQFCSKSSTQLVLVLPSKNTPFKTQAQNLLMDYSRKFSLNHIITSVNVEEETDEIASKIISQFYYGHKTPPKKPPTADAKKNALFKLKKPLTKKSLFFLPLILAIPYLLALLQIGTIYLFGSCFISSFEKSAISETVYCSRVAAKLADFVYPQVNVCECRKVSEWSAKSRS